MPTVKKQNFKDAAKQYFRDVARLKRAQIFKSSAAVTVSNILITAFGIIGGTLGLLKEGKLTSLGFIYVIFCVILSIVGVINMAVKNLRENGQIKYCKEDMLLCANQIVAARSKLDVETTEKILERAFTRDLSKLTYKASFPDPEAKVHALLKNLKTDLMMRFPKIKSNMICISLYYKHEGLPEWMTLTSTDKYNTLKLPALLENPNSTLSRVVTEFEKTTFEDCSIYGSKEDLRAKKKYVQSPRDKNFEKNGKLTGTIICIPFDCNSPYTMAAHDISGILSISTYQEELADDHSDNSLEKSVRSYIDLYIDIIKKELAYKHLLFKIDKAEVDSGSKEFLRKGSSKAVLNSINQLNRYIVAEILHKMVTMSPGHNDEKVLNSADITDKLFEKICYSLSLVYPQAEMDKIAVGMYYKHEGLTDWEVLGAYNDIQKPNPKKMINKPNSSFYQVAKMLETADKSGSSGLEFYLQGSKRRLAEQGKYVFGIHDAGYDKVGTILCMALTCKEQHSSMEADVLGIICVSTFGVELCDDSDEAAKTKLREHIKLFFPRIQIEMAYAYSKFKKNQLKQGI